MTFRCFALTACFAPCALAITLNGTVGGTCGFYFGDPSNIVFSETFSGNTGSFCTSFMSGGSFMPGATLQAGDIFALSSHNTLALAPSGFGVFANFNTEFQVTQQYILTGITSPSTTTGTVNTFFSHVGGTDDGSGLGSCLVNTSLSVNGISSTTQGGTNFQFQVTFGQPFSVTEEAHMSCNEHAPGPGWGDGGMNSTTLGPLLVSDANGKFLGNAVAVSVPEPGGALTFASLLVLAPMWRRHSCLPRRDSPRRFRAATTTEVSPR